MAVSFTKFCVWCIWRQIRQYPKQRTLFFSQNTDTEKYNFGLNEAKMMWYSKLTYQKCDRNVSKNLDQMTFIRYFLCKYRNVMTFTTIYYLYQILKLTKTDVITSQIFILDGTHKYDFGIHKYDRA